MRVSCERYIEEIVDATVFNGYLRIGGVKFDYELKFAVPVPQITTQKLPDDKDEFRRLSLITVKKDGANINLTHEEYYIFWQMLALFASKFYYFRRKEAVFLDVSILSTTHCQITQEICEVLNVPKFGCKLAE